MSSHRGDSVLDRSCPGRVLNRKATLADRIVHILRGRCLGVSVVNHPTSIFVKTTSLYAGICDQRSPANIDGFMDDLLNAAHREAQQEGFAAGHGVFLFNSVLMRRAEQGDILTWPLLYDGVFGCRFAVLKPGERGASQSADVPRAARVAGRLNFPSGQVIISCLRRLGPRAKSSITVPPGWYEVTITRDENMESRHALLENEADYPADEGPDWVVELRRAEG